MSKIERKCVDPDKRKLIFRVLLVILWLALFSMRIIHLDSDMPNYGIAFYQQIDEGPYVYLALHEMNYGCINPDIRVTEVNQYTSPHLRMNIIGNLLTYITLRIFGNNYYGLRMSSVICMLINYLLIYLILCRIKKKYVDGYNDSKYVLVGLFGILTLDFTFVLASRIVETSIYRMLLVLLGIYVSFALEKRPNMKFFLLGIISMFSVFGVYITNIFFVVSCIAVIGINFIINNKRKAIIEFIFYSFGSVLVILMCDLYMRLFWNEGLIENCLQIVNNFSNVEGYVDASVFNRVYYIINFFASSFNMYNPGILLLFLSVFPIVFLYFFKQKDENMLLMVFSYIFLFIQTVISEDYIIRKSIIVVPIIIFMVYIGFFNLEQYVGEWNKKKKFIYSLYVNLCSFLILSIYIYRFKFMKDGSSDDFSKWDKRIIFVLAVFVVLFIMNYLMMRIWSGNYINIKIWCILLGGLLSISIYMNFKFIYSNNTYSDREIMIELQDIPKESNYIVGQYMQSFSLYNDCIPVVNYHDAMKETLLEHKNWLYFDYATNWNPNAENYMEGILAGSGYHLVCEREFERSTKTLGVVRNVALYRVEKINE